MDTLGLSTQLKVRQCSQCQRDTEFYCNTCKHDLCLQCKKKHATQNSTKYHNVVFYRTRYTDRSFTMQCKVRHCSQCQGDTEFYCNTCKRDLCLQCKKKHATQNSTKYHNVVLYRTRYTDRSFTMQCKVRQCSQCQGDTEFYCNTCKRDLCLQCKKKHVIDVYTIYHVVVIYREKFKSVPLRATCVRHPNRKYRMFCDDCNYSVCRCCTDHSTHKLVDLRTSYQTKRQQHRKTIDNIRSATFYNCRVFLTGIQIDIQICPSQICHLQSQMSKKAQKLKDRIDKAVCDVKTRYRGLLIDRIQQQKRKMNRHLTHIQNYEDRYEQSVNRAVQFLLFIKTSRVPQIKDTPNLPQHLLLSLTEGFNMEDVNQLLRGIPEIQMTIGKRQVGIDEFVKLTSTPVLLPYVCATGVNHVRHISRVMSDRVWVSDDNNLILTDITGDTIHRVTDITTWFAAGIHTVNSSGELIYIDSKYNINKLSLVNETKTIPVIKSTSPWVPMCVYFSPSTGYLVVGMCNTDTYKYNVTLYSSTGKHILTIERDNKGRMLYNDPKYITENRNGDIIVANEGRVVVTERGGRFRFYYKGPTSGSLLLPWGVCTDALSHILVGDYSTDTVQIIDKDGHFLSALQIRNYGIAKPLSLFELQTELHVNKYPCCLNYDDKTHLLWVGSLRTNTVSVYIYIQRMHSLTYNTDGDEDITEASSYGKAQESGSELGISEESEFDEYNNPDGDEEMTEASSYEEDQESGSELEISEESEFDEYIEELMSKVTSQASDPDEKDTAES